MDENRTHLINGLRSGGVYGLGLVIGTASAILVMNLVTLDFLTQVFQLPRLALGFVLAFLIMGVAGGAAGFAGGYSLKMVHQERGRTGYAWRSALSFAIPFSLLIFLTVLAISLLTFYNVEEIPVTSYMVVFLGVGLLFGVVFGTLFGILGPRRQGFRRILGYSLLGYGAGGAVLGYFIWNAIYAFRVGENLFSETLLLLIGLFFFAAVGGADLGFLFSRMSEEAPREPTPPSALRIIVRGVGIVVFIIIFFAACRPLREEVRNYLAPQTSFLTQQFDLRTLGTHWVDAVSVKAAPTPGASGPAVAAQQDRLVLTWSEAGEGTGSDVFILTGAWDPKTGRTTWSAETNVSNSPSVASEGSEIFLSPDGTAHMVWSEGGERILYAECGSSGCGEPVQISGTSRLPCETGATRNPDLSISLEDQVLVVWETGAANVPYTTWTHGDQIPSSPAGCVFNGDLSAEALLEPLLEVSTDGEFMMVAGSDQPAGDVHAVWFSDNSWEINMPPIGVGRWPEVYVDPTGDLHIAYCGSGGNVQYLNVDERTGGSVGDAVCSGRPVIGMDAESGLHVLWYAETIKNVLGGMVDTSVLLESHQLDSGWSKPAIITHIGKKVQPALAHVEDGSLHLIWDGETELGEALNYAHFVPYQCDPDDLVGIPAIIFNVARQEKYRTPDNPVPFCQNQYVNLVHAPNPDPAFSDLPQTESGPYDVVAALATSARYEILFTTMWYDQDGFENDGNPGSILARGVKALYDQLAANPEQYPRGLTVRILLGNPPEVSRLEFNNQLWFALTDLRDAGVPEMVNEELGWNLEVANYRGALPHSHTKALIVDGARMIAAGFNYQYSHFPLGHPSGKSEGRWDLGIEVTGPVVQDAVRVFDDLWAGATLRQCDDFHPALDAAWQTTCRDRLAVATHLPETSKYYRPGDNATVFSMFRTEKRDESDQEIIAALDAAQESVEILQVNFAMNPLCNLNYLYDVCTFEEASDWGQAIIQAAKNGAQVRVLIKLAPADGVENAITVGLFSRELEARGLTDQVEIRTFGDQAVHYKGMLVDDQFVVVGSQNFHYSAFGDGTGLAEYNLGTADPRAVEDFKKLFEFHWDQGVPVIP